MGWDDNGLPTERRVQNYFHVRCDPGALREGLRLEPAGAKQRKEPPRLVSRPNFIEAVRHGDPGGREGLSRRCGAALGLSVDWRQEYADDRRPLPAHLPAFVPRPLREGPRLHERRADHVGRRLPVRDRPGRARGPREARRLPRRRVRRRGQRSQLRDLATTRPELLPACVGVTAHPDDERYRELFGKRADHAAVPRAGADLSERARPTRRRARAS